jgi:tRNA A58 N-methylase Trm61
MQTVNLDLSINTIDSIVIERLQESAETLAECIKKDVARAADAKRTDALFMDIDDSIRMLRKLNSVIKYFGGDPVDWTGYK